MTSTDEDDVMLTHLFAEQQALAQQQAHLEAEVAGTLISMDKSSSEAVEPKQIVPKKRGRPLGVPNKPKASKESTTSASKSAKQSTSTASKSTKQPSSSTSKSATQLKTSASTSSFSAEPVNDSMDVDVDEDTNTADPNEEEPTQPAPKKKKAKAEPRDEAWTLAEEKELLMKRAKMHKKFQDCKDPKKANYFWKAIATELQATSGKLRNDQNVRKKWSNLRTKYKTYLKKIQFGTGLGPDDVERMKTECGNWKEMEDAFEFDAALSPLPLLETDVEEQESPLPEPLNKENIKLPQPYTKQSKREDKMDAFERIPLQLIQTLLRWYQNLFEV
jgi:hypothetical protein